MAEHEPHTCAHHDSFDPETLEPTGPACGRAAMQELYWRDGRVSPSCADHGKAALDDDARAMVVRVVYPVREEQWATRG